MNSTEGAPLQAAGYLRHSVEILPTGRRSKLRRITQLAMKLVKKENGVQPGSVNARILQENISFESRFRALSSDGGMSRAKFKVLAEEFSEEIKRMKKDGQEVKEAKKPESCVLDKTLAL